MPVTMVLLRPVTGRRHQLRVHCAALGHPIGTVGYAPCSLCYDRLFAVLPYLWTRVCMQWATRRTALLRTQLLE